MAFRGGEQAFELRLWPHQHPLRQFGNALSLDLLNKLEQHELSLDRLRDMEPAEISALIRSPMGGRSVASCVAAFPFLHLTATLHPLTRCARPVFACLLLPPSLRQRLLCRLGEMRKLRPSAAWSKF